MKAYTQRLPNSWLKHLSFEPESLIIGPTRYTANAKARTVGVYQTACTHPICMLADLEFCVIDGYGPPSSCHISITKIMIEYQLCPAPSVSRHSAKEPLSNHQPLAAMSVARPSPAEDFMRNHNNSAAIPHSRKENPIESWNYYVLKQ